MLRAKYIIICAAFALVGFAQVVPVAAFQYSGQAWCCDTIHYYVNPANPTSVCGGAIMGPWFQSRINTAAGIWNSQGMQFKLVNVGTTAVACSSSVSPGVCMGRKDGQNTIAMAKGCSWSDNSIIAYSTWWYWTAGDSACCMFESDICFSDNVMWFNDVNNCSGSCYDLISVAAHEIGHWIASGHENDNGVLGYKPIMYYSFNFCEMRRSVTADDAALLGWGYDAEGSILNPYRCSSTHQHPPYSSPPTHDTCYYCPDGPPFCDSVQYDPCLLVCPQTDMTFMVTVKDSCGHPVCDLAGTWLDFSDCLSTPCLGEEPEWPIVHPDSCDIVTGRHYFKIDAGMIACDFCNPALVVGGDACRTITARFFDNNGDRRVTDADFIGGRVCEDYNCNFATDPGDSLIWAQHKDHHCAVECDCRPGDANNDGQKNVGDAVYLIAYVFKGGAAPWPYSTCSGDANGDCSANVGDAVYMIAYVFKGGAAPVDCPTWLLNCGLPLR